MSTTFEITAKGPFDFAASRQFLAGFEPSKRLPEPGPIRLGLLAERTFEPYAAEISPTEEGVCCEIVGDVDTASARDQITHLLSLDVDGAGFADVLTNDPVLDGLRDAIGTLRPVMKLSPYEAAAWAIISARISMKQAANVKQRMEHELGTTLDLNGSPVHTFPPPHVLLELGEFRGLFGRQIEYLHALAQAALDGELDTDRFRGMSTQDAIAHCQTLKGVGPFSAELIVVRGVGTVDHLPENESRLLDAARLAYDRPEMTADDLRELAEQWRPYRTWAVVMLRAWLESVTDERGGPSVA